MRSSFWAYRQEKRKKENIKKNKHDRNVMKHRKTFAYSLFPSKKMISLMTALTKIILVDQGLPCVHCHIPRSSRVASHSKETLWYPSTRNLMASPTGQSQSQCVKSCSLRRHDWQTGSLVSSSRWGYWCNKGGDQIVA